MSDRGILFLFSVFMVIAGLAAAAWLILTGQAGTVDGLFLLLTSLLVAFAFGLYIRFMVKRALASLQQETVPAKPKPAAAPAPKPAPVTASKTEQTVPEL